MTKWERIETAAPLVPERPTLESLREAARGCKACNLWRTGTQTVFGEGARNAEVMLERLGFLHGPVQVGASVEWRKGVGWDGVHVGPEEESVRRPRDSHAPHSSASLICISKPQRLA